MWHSLVKTILRRRIWILAILSLFTLVLAFFASQVQMSYSMPQLLPNSNPTQQAYQAFVNQYGADANVMFIGVSDPQLLKLASFQEWDIAQRKIKNIDGVVQTLSHSNAFELRKNPALSKFTLQRVIEREPLTQDELDSAMIRVSAMPFYDGYLYNSESGAMIMMVFLDKNTLNSSDRDAVVYEIVEVLEEFSEQTNIDVHLSGMPYIRTVTAGKLKHELILFSFIALCIAATILYAFYRSSKVMIWPICIVTVSVIWALGFSSLMGFELTILSCMIPPLLIIIGVENSIYLINKYHVEYQKHGRKYLSILRAVQRIGKANLLTNLTTAAGFLAFVSTGNAILVAFGLIASLSILVSFVLTIILLPIAFSYQSVPNAHDMRHLNNAILERILAKIEVWVTRFRQPVFLVAAVVFILSILGLSRLETSGRVVDDIPQREKLYQDMTFFERELGGIMPLEITVDTKRPKGIMRLASLNKIEAFQGVLATYPELSKPLSIVELLKFGRQAYYNGNPRYYGMPNASEFAFIYSYLPSFSPIDTLPNMAKMMMNTFMDSSMQTARLSVHMKNVSTPRIREIRDELAPAIHSIFDTAQYNVSLTGSSVVFLEGTEYLIRNLWQSLVIALLLIIAIMFIVFKSVRMVCLAVLPNIFPLLVTAGLMGFFNWPIKTSTILIFSVALGISIDSAIHFLSRYRLELRINQGKVKEAVVFALGEAGFSMCYSTTILFFGFIIFAFSSFGGTQYFGILVSLTLLVALASNLILLPSLLLAFAQKRVKKDHSQTVQ